MSGRLVLAIISTMMEEAAIALIVLWALPKVDVNLPLAVLVVLMAAWLAYNIATYRMGTRALKRHQVFGLANMVGSKGKIISSLTPEGLAKVNGEIWAARSVNGKIEVGEEVVVVEQERLKLVVRSSKPARDLEGPE